MLDRERPAIPGTTLPEIEAAGVPQKPVGDSLSKGHILLEEVRAPKMASDTRRSGTRGGVVVGIRWNADEKDGSQ